MNRVRPTAARASSTSLVRSSRASFLWRSGKRTLLRTVDQGISERLYSWNTTAISSGGAVTGSPCSRTSPRVGRSRPAMHLSSVVLPQPEGPTTQTSSRSAIENEMLRSACVTLLPEPYDFATSRISSTGWLLGGRRPPPAVPCEHAPLGEQVGEVEDVADDADEDDRGPHRPELERVLRDEQHVADAARRREVLGDDHDDHGEREADPHSRGDLREGGGQHDAPDPLVGRDAVGARGVDERRVEGADPVDRVEQHREDAEERDERDLLQVPDRVEQEHRDRQKRGRWHRPPVLDVRHRELPGPQRHPERDADRDADRRADPEPEQDAHQARDEVAPELLEHPEVVELLQDLRRRRPELAVRRARPELPDHDDRDRDGDLRRPPLRGMPA